MKNCLSVHYWPCFESLREQMALGALWLVFFPSARTCSLARRPTLLCYSCGSSSNAESPLIDMPTLKILPEARSSQVARGTGLLQASLMAGIELPQACGGRASCTTCRVLVKEGATGLSPLQLAEREMLAESGLLGRYRLACQARVLGDVVVERPHWPWLNGSDATTGEGIHRE